MTTKLVLTPSWPVFELSEGKICIDIGANNGGMTQSMLHSGALKVYAIEAGKINCNVIRERFKNNDNVVVFETAVSDEKGTLKNVTWLNAWVIGNPDEIKLPISPGACDVEGYDRVDIEMDTVDNIFSSIPDEIGFIKIDVDGYDFKVLKGSINLINRCRPVIFIELSYYYDIIPGSSVTEFLKFVTSINYEFISLDGKLCSTDYILQEFPFHSSCDVFICPAEKISLFSNRIVK